MLVWVSVGWVWFSIVSWAFLVAVDWALRAWWRTWRRERRRGGGRLKTKRIADIGRGPKVIMERSSGDDSRNCSSNNLR